NTLRHADDDRDGDGRRQGYDGDVQHQRDRGRRVADDTGGWGRADRNGGNDSADATLGAGGGSVQQSRRGRHGDVDAGDRERVGQSHDVDERREWHRGDHLDAGHGGGDADRAGDRCGIARALQRDGDGRRGRDDCGEQSDEPVGYRGHGGQYATVGDREGRERESGGAGGGDVRGGAGEWEHHGRQSDHQCEWRGDGGELDVERDGRLEHVDGHFRDLVRQPGHVHGDGDGGGGRDDCGEQSDQPVDHGGNGRRLTALGDREGREQVGRGAGGGGVRGGAGEREDHGSKSDNQCEWRGDGGELDEERDGQTYHLPSHFRDLVRQPGHVHGDGDGGGGGDDCGEQSDQPVGHGGNGRRLTALGDREGRE